MVAINCMTVRHSVRHCKILFLLLDEIEKFLTVYNFCKTQKVWGKKCLTIYYFGCKTKIVKIKMISQPVGILPMYYISKILLKVVYRWPLRSEGNAK